MKIVIATSRAFHLAHLARELARLKHDVTLIGYVPRSRMERYDFGSAEYIDLFTKLLPWSATALQRPLQKLCTKSTFGIMPRYDRIVAGMVPPCDVLIGLSGVIVDTFDEARMRHGALTICDRGSAHVLFQKQAIDPDDSGRIPSEYVDRELASYAKSDFVAVPSSFAMRSFVNHDFPRERMFVNTYGVNTDRFYPRSPRSTASSNIKAIFVGGWSYQKGCDLIAKALERLPNFEVTHAGVKRDLPFPTSPRFRSLGHVDNSKLPSVYAEHDVLILPSRQDGFGMVLLEAAACGLSVIGSENTGAADLLGLVPNKCLVRVFRPNTVEAMIETLREMKNQTLSQGTVEANVSQALSWSSYASRYALFLERALQSRVGQSGNSI